MSNGSSHQDSTNQLRPIDPIEALPQEMLSRVFFFLPPSSIATSSALNKVWRNSILSNPILHQEIDLTKLNRDEDMTNILYHFSRLSSLASNRLVKVSLNLTAFWNEFVEAALSNNKRILLFDVFLNLLRNSRESLKELSVVIGATKSEYDNPIGFILLLIQELQVYKSIKSIVVEAPVEYSLTAGDGGAGLRSFFLRDSKERSPEMLADEPNIPEVLREVKKLVEGKITEFQTWFVCDLDLSREESQGILKELEDSKDSIRTLGLSLLQVSDERDFWKFAIRCPKITSLDLLMGKWPDTLEPEKQLEIPPRRDAAASQMKEFKIKSDYTLDWGSSREWIGGKLEVLTIACSLSSPLTLESHNTLREISLTENTLGDFKMNEFDFPNLEDLLLRWVSSSCFTFFSKIKTQKIRKLHITSKGNAGECYKCLYNILSSCSTSLTRVVVELEKDGQGEDPYSLTHSQSSFKFSRLERFKLGYGCHQTLIRWLSTSSFPNLITLDLPSEYRESNSTAEDFNIQQQFRQNAPKAVFETYYWN